MQIVKMFLELLIAFVFLDLLEMEQFVLVCPNRNNMYTLLTLYILITKHNKLTP